MLRGSRKTAKVPPAVNITRQLVAGEVFCRLAGLRPVYTVKETENHHGHGSSESLKPSHKRMSNRDGVNRVDRSLAVLYVDTPQSV